MYAPAWSTRQPPASASECSGERASFEVWRGEIRDMRAAMMVWHMIRDEVVPVPVEELDERIDMAGQFIDRGQRALSTRQRRPAPQPIFPGRAALTLLLLSETVQYTRRSSATEHASVRPTSARIAIPPICSGHIDRRHFRRGC